MLAKFAKLLKDRRGVAASEFALVAPIMVLLWCGVVEMTQLLRAHRNLVQTAQSMGDLIAQENVVDDDDIADVVSAARLIMSPFPTSTLNVHIASVMFNTSSGAPEILWEEPSGGEGIEEDCEGLGLPGEGVIVVTLDFIYEPIFADLIVGSVTLHERAFDRPRRTRFISRI